MSTTVNLRKVLHRKSMEMCTPALVSTGAGMFITGDRGGLMPQNDCVYYVAGVSAIYNYSPEQDAWMQLPNSGAAGAFGAGACGEFRCLGAMGGTSNQTATAGTTTTLTTNKSIVRSLAGSKVRVVAGTGIGYEGTVASNTVGTNAVITVTPANGVAFDNTTVFQVWSGSVWFMNAGTSAVGFNVYDRATNSWTARSVTGLPTAWGTTGQLVSTGSIEGAFETGTATAGAASTLTNSAKAWPTNCYANAQVRITAGTGIGQIRVIASNTGTVLTTATAWTVNPDATSVYSIEGCDDYIYLLGNNAVTLYRYTVSTNTWATITPGSARSAALGAGGSADWIHNCPDADWQGAQGKLLTGAGMLKQNGRFIYSFRGAASSALDIYDIATNTWWNSVGYGNQNDTFSSGSSAVDNNGMIYITKENTGRIYRFDVAKHALEPLTTNLHPQGASCEGDKLVIVTYRDGATTIPFLYTLQQTRIELLRMLLI